MLVRFVRIAPAYSLIVHLVSSERPVNAYVQGYGTLLMREAERIAQHEHRSTRLAVISGVGTRHYYRKLGYRLEGHYMVKDFMALSRRPRRRQR